MSRRKVVSAEHLHGHAWQIRFVCELECGHSQHADGRYDRSNVGTRTVPPKSVTCRRCAKQPTSHGAGVSDE